MRIETKTMYVTEDGSLFEDKEDCLDYEDYINKQKELKEREVRFIPIVKITNDYQWYKVYSKEDFEHIYTLYVEVHADYCPSMQEYPQSYPAIIACITHEDKNMNNLDWCDVEVDVLDNLKKTVLEIEEELEKSVGD